MTDCGALRARLGPALAGGTLRIPAGLPVPDVTDRSTWDTVPAAAREPVLAAARHELDRPQPVLLASDWARAFRDGVRTAYEDPARALRERVAVLAVAAVLTGETAQATAPPGGVPHLDGAVDGLVALAEAGTWCWAPHDRGAAARGEVVPDPGRPFLDLGAAEVAVLVAWADHALGPHLDVRAPGLRRRLRQEVERRVLRPFEDVRDWHWIGRDGDAHNWNPWIHGAVLAATLAVVDDAERRARLVRLVVEGLDHYLRVQPDDGGVDEGVQYWWLGAGRLLEALDLLAAAGGEALDARDLPVLAELARYPHRMHLGDDWYVNVGDCPARPSPDQAWHVPFRWGVRLGDAAVRGHALARGRTGPAARPRAGLGRALEALADRGWTTAHAGAADAGAPWLAPHAWLPRVQVLVAREDGGSTRGLTVAAKAGHNDERHNHLDVGTFWVTVDGRPLVVDVGQPTYTAASFGPDRYRAWPLGSDWHNVPDPGSPQGVGAEHRACDVRAELGPAVAALHADLTAAYPAGRVARWERTVRLVRGPGAHALVEDRWAGEAPVLLRHVLAGSVRVERGRAVVTAPATRPLVLTWDPALAAAEVADRPLDDPLLRAVWGEGLTRLTLRAGAAVRALTVRLEIATEHRG
ncbi:heparinase II/III domain-containing protein [Pseudonocardia sichuanensis]